jgi:hypothetical protein
MPCATLRTWYHRGVENHDDASSVSFANFALWLGTMAAVQFGDVPDPATGEAVEPNLGAAREMIEILAMLQQKTKGNLDDLESKLLDDLLYDLRLRYVDAQKGGRRIIEP